MLVSLNWLKDYTDVKVPVSEFCDRMIMSGSDMETCEELGAGIEGVVVGRIEKIEKHPQADKLVVCQLNVGKEETVQIVTGATNVYEGGYVPVALDGAHIPGPLHGQPKTEDGVIITAGELRGIASNGMLCGPQELGIEDKTAPYVSKTVSGCCRETGMRILGKTLRRLWDFTIMQWISALRRTVRTACV